jgi:peroxiredoxin
VVQTYSTMLPLGTKAPEFALPDVVSGKTIDLECFTGKHGLLVMFICAHCPYVKHIKEELSRLGRDYTQKSLGIVAISANDADTYKDDSPENLKKFAQEIGLNYPLCHDESQAVAQSYTAACTPDFFLFGADRLLVYRGQLDDSRPGNGKAVTGADLRKAIDDLLNNQPVFTEQKPSVGCNIKWKPGMEPKY